jgi:hypothetical protein
MENPLHLVLGGEPFIFGMFTFVESASPWGTVARGVVEKEKRLCWPVAWGKSEKGREGELVQEDGRSIWGNIS